MKLTVKGDNVNLRDFLEREGFRFPCGGKGSCGRCRIVAPALPVTDKDRKFLNADEIARGVRLACDKVVNGAKPKSKPSVTSAQTHTRYFATTRRI